MSDDDGDTQAALSSLGSNAPVALFVREAATMDASTSLRQAAATMDQEGAGLVVIGHNSGVEGVVSERDIVRAAANGVDLDTTTVAAIESTALKWATPESVVGDVVEEMMECYVRHVLVGGDEQQLVGVVSMRDLVAAYLD